MQNPCRSGVVRDGRRSRGQRRFHRGVRGGGRASTVKALARGRWCRRVCRRVCRRGGARPSWKRSRRGGRTPLASSGAGRRRHMSFPGTETTQFRRQPIVAFPASRSTSNGSATDTYQRKILPAPRAASIKWLIIDHIFADSRKCPKLVIVRCNICRYFVHTEGKHTQSV